MHGFERSRPLVSYFSAFHSRTWVYLLNFISKLDNDICAFVRGGKIYFRYGRSGIIASMLDLQSRIGMDEDQFINILVGKI